MRAGKNCKLSTFLSCMLRLILKWVTAPSYKCINGNTDASAAKSNLLFDLEIHIGKISFSFDLLFDLTCSLGHCNLQRSCSWSSEVSAKYCPT